MSIDYKVRIKRDGAVIASGKKVRADTPEEAARAFCGRPVQKKAADGADLVQVCVPPQDEWVNFYRPRSAS